MSRVYVWLIVHGACPCAVERYTRPVTRGWLSRLCRLLDARLFDGS